MIIYKMGQIKLIAETKLGKVLDWSNFRKIMNIMFNELYIMNIMNIILFIICMNRPKSKLNKEDI